MVSFSFPCLGPKPDDLTDLTVLFGDGRQDAGQGTGSHVSPMGLDLQNQTLHSRPARTAQSSMADIEPRLRR